MPSTAPLAPPPDVSAIHAAWEAQYASAPPPANGHAPAAPPPDVSPTHAAWEAQYASAPPPTNGHALAAPNGRAEEESCAAPSLAPRASGDAAGAAAWPGVGASPSKRRKVWPGCALGHLATYQHPMSDTQINDACAGASHITTYQHPT